MKFLWTTLVVIALAATATGLVCFRMNFDPQLHAAAAKGDAMLWLRTDFHLTDGQFAAIQQVHAAYAGTCAEHCRMIQEATRARDALRTRHGADPAAATAAERNLQDLRATCESAIATHVRQVAALMSPDDGRRYLALVLPRIADFDHTAAPNLLLSHPH